MIPQAIRTTLETVRHELEQTPGVVAVGIFGSVRHSRLWEHSDIDLFVLVDVPGQDELWQGVGLVRDGIPVNLQLLSLVAFAAALESHRHSPFWAALSDVEVWFDTDGALTAAVAAAVDGPEGEGAAWQAFKRFAKGVGALHSAEKHARMGTDWSARASLAQALEALASAALLVAGTYPARDLWAQPAATTLPEYALVEALWRGDDVAPLIHQALEGVHALLLERCRPFIALIAEHGPLTGEGLAALPALRGVELPDRLIDALLATGTLVEGSAPHPVLGIRQRTIAAR